MTRQYGDWNRRFDSMDSVAETAQCDLRDIGRRLDALEAGRRSSEPEQREVGWYVVSACAAVPPICLYWDGETWRHWRRGTIYAVSEPPDWIGPRLDLPEGR